MPELESLTPAKGLEMYLQNRGDECAESTLKAHEYRLGHFVRWCESNEINNLNDITGRRLHEFRLWRKEDGDLNRVSVRTQMSTLRAFMGFCAQIDAVEVGLKDAVDVDEVGGNEATLPPTSQLPRRGRHTQAAS